MASSIRFGSSCGPCKSPATERAQPAEEFGKTKEKGNCDPDKLLQCPFDKNHLIRACRFPYHIIKCKKQHPKLAEELKTCPFNARHLVPRHELARHYETCEDRIPVHASDDVETNGHCKWQVPVSTWVNPNMSEDWDNEADDTAAPFVWGQHTSLTGRRELPLTNNLGPSSRAPKTLPWLGFKP